MHHDPLDKKPASDHTVESSPPFDASGLFDQRLTRALEAAPRADVPADFAARLLARLPPRPLVPQAIPVPATHYGRSAILIGIVVLLAAMVMLAGHAVNHAGLEAILEWTLCAQFVALTIWYTAWRKGAN